MRAPGKNAGAAVGVLVMAFAVSAAVQARRAEIEPFWRAACFYRDVVAEEVTMDKLDAVCRRELSCKKWGAVRGLKRAAVFEKIFNIDFFQEEGRINIKTALRNRRFLNAKKIDGRLKRPAETALLSVLEKRRPVEAEQWWIDALGLQGAEANEFFELYTVYGDGRIDINSVSEGVMRRLGFSASCALKLVRFRRGHDAVPNTADDRRFLSQEFIFEDLEREKIIEGPDRLLFVSLAGLFKTNSEYYLARIEEVTQEGPVPYARMIFFDCGGAFETCRWVRCG